MKLFKKAAKFGAIATATLAVSASSYADIAADAVAELTTVKTGVETVGPGLIGVVGVIALVGVVTMMLKRTR